MNYYENSFTDIQTSTIQMWLREAQIMLDYEVGATRSMLLEGIRAAAAELRHRYRQHKLQSLST